MSTTEDLTVAIRTLTDLTDPRARSESAQKANDADLRAALKRTVPELLAIMTAGFGGDDDLTIHAVNLARLVNAQPDSHPEQPC
ncbi:hypothetical protein [Cryobacterium sp. Y57]|uniref:hypothetical protein n=1 Tax=Cryobacterium sp. Y57 TaxID=2048287 RepID=UPI000CE2E565|nr:hypothetical protein [Cryobacterium sp. Y57]